MEINPVRESLRVIEIAVELKQAFPLAVCYSLFWVKMTLLAKKIADRVSAFWLSLSVMGLLDKFGCNGPFG